MDVQKLAEFEALKEIDFFDPTILFVFTCAFFGDIFFWTIILHYIAAIFIGFFLLPKFHHFIPKAVVFVSLVLPLPVLIIGLVLGILLSNKLIELLVITAALVAITAATAGTTTAATATAEAGVMSAEGGAAVAEAGAAVAEGAGAVAETGAAVAETGTAVAETGTAVAETGTAVAETGTAVAETGAEVAETGAEVAEAGGGVAEAGGGVAEAGGEASEAGGGFTEAGGETSGDIGGKGVTQEGTKKTFGQKAKDYARKKVTKKLEDRRDELLSSGDQEGDNQEEFSEPLDLSRMHATDDVGSQTSPDAPDDEIGT